MMSVRSMSTVEPSPTGSCRQTRLGRTMTAREPSSELITSAANPLVKRVRALADRKQRRREGAFLVEGAQPVWRAVEAGWEIDTLLVVPARLADSGREMVT